MHKGNKYMIQKKYSEFKIPSEFNKKLLFASLSGSHVYNSPNINSDIDLRCIHIEPTEDILSLHPPNLTYEKTIGLYDVVSHEIYKFLSLLLKGNGNLYEILYSPIILYENDNYIDELKKIAENALSKQVYFHYYGFASHMLSHSYHSEEKRYRKNVLYLFRNLLSGIHVLEKKKFILNFDELCEIYNFKPDFHFVTMAYQNQAKELFTQLLEAKSKSSLKEKSDKDDIKNADKLLLRIRRENYG